MDAESAFLNERKLGRGRVPEELRSKLGPTEGEELKPIETHERRVERLLLDIRHLIASRQYPLRRPDEITEVLKYSQYSLDLIPPDVEREVAHTVIERLRHEVEYLQNIVSTREGKTRRARRWMVSLAALNLAALVWNIAANGLG